ncbi:Serine protease inhibitor I/II-like Protein [Tribolium castaneum]|uniref:Protease inhibitor n=1 Tax=Tribolium castaneum TaxID=7070 RepID=D2A563_TRICA|nr:Serine protease inhibitor I/II-like Protein [Tribolium castaneum]
MKTLILCCLVLSVLIASVVSEEAECNNGDTKKVDCNSCRCTNGLWSCTKKVCLERKTRNAFSCKPGETFKRDCNSCTCTLDGKNAVYTVCQPGTTFKKDCNTCVCNKDGTNAACTLKACL